MCLKTFGERSDLAKPKVLRGSAQLKGERGSAQRRARLSSKESEAQLKGERGSAQRRARLSSKESEAQLEIARIARRRALLSSKERGFCKNFEWRYTKC
jgi:hypothetical protein